MPRPFTRKQQLENAAFLRALRKTGNARRAAEELGVHRGTYTKRRARSPAFAAAWDAALTFAHARLRDRNPPEALLEEGDHPQNGGGAAQRSAAVAPRLVAARSADGKSRTTGGEPHLVRCAATGRLQLRRAPAGRMTRAAEQTFLAALSATANIRLAAAAAGFAPSSFYVRKRASRAFAREMRLALEAGWERLEEALLRSADPASAEDDAWRSNDPPATPPLTAAEALQLLHLHRNAVKHSWTEPHRRRRRDEPEHVYSLRLQTMWLAEQRHIREDQAIRDADRTNERGRGARTFSAQDHPAPEVPPLSLIRDQLAEKNAARPRSSRTAGKTPKEPGLPMFGGWRIGDWEE